MKFLITGCAGFIGSHTCDAFLEANEEVIGLDSMTYAARQKNIDRLKQKDGFSFVSADICDSSLLKDLISREKVTHIVNFAAETHVDNSIKDVKPFIHSNVIGVSSLIDAVRDLDAHLIHISTDEVYGVPDPGQIFTEESPLSPRNPYSATKASADHLILSAINTYKISARIIRPSNNFGPGQHGEKFIPTVLRSVLREEKIPVYGDGKQKREWTYVKDTARSIAKFCLDERYHTESVIHNLSSEDQFTNMEVIRRICEILEKDSSNLIKFVSDRPGHDREYRIKNSILTSKTEFSVSLRETIEYYIKNRD